ncbi:hypothetical protein ACLB2K_017460 [Fragaria x ananassa]
MGVKRGSLKLWFYGREEEEIRFAEEARSETEGGSSDGRRRWVVLMQLQSVDGGVSDGWRRWIPVGSRSFGRNKRLSFRD